MTRPTTAQLNAAYDQLNFWYDKAKKLDEELAKAQDRIAELEASQLAVKLPEQYPDDGDLSFFIDLYDEGCEENLRLAMWLKELRRRRGIGDYQLAVKLPDRLQPGADGPDDWYLHSDPDGEYMKADDVIEAIRTAGITVQGGE